MNNPEFDLLAFKLSALLGRRVPKLVESARPDFAQPFKYSGEIPQTVTQFAVGTGVTAGNKDMLAQVFTTPDGMTGVINRVNLAEGYIGAFYGSHAAVLINGGIEGTYGRVGHSIGIGCNVAQDCWVPLKERDVVGLLIECPWNTVQFQVQETTTRMLTWHFEISGYFLDKEIFSEDICSNEDAA